jgi:hypothetical protein
MPAAAQDLANDPNLGVKLVCRNFSFPGLDRMDNLLKVQI